MGMAKLLWPRVITCAKAVWTGVLRFTGEERKRIVAESEARVGEIRAAADADKTRAEAAKINAEAAQATAVAEETRAQTRRKDAILKELCKRKMNWQEDLDDEGQTRIVVTRQSLIDLS